MDSFAPLTALFLAGELSSSLLGRLLTLDEIDRRTPLHLVFDLSYILR